MITGLSEIYATISDAALLRAPECRDGLLRPGYDRGAYSDCWAEWGNVTLPNMPQALLPLLSSAPGDRSGTGGSGAPRFLAQSAGNVYRLRHAPKAPGISGR
jgi:hypothetical protein